MNKTIVVAMSGGVDSSTTAALLKKKGYKVIGLTMCFNLPDNIGKNPGCCSITSIDHARAVAYKLGIKHYVLNMQRALKDYVIDDFCQEYLKGRTPNPCIRCNEFIKFGILLRKSISLGASYLATGHYARISKCAGELCLKKAKDLKKDQSYFLYRLTQEQLKNIIFPLGNHTKDEVRSLARSFGLLVSDKPDSQEICFLPDNDYRGFLMRKFANKDKTFFKPGPIIDREGNILGQHKGIAFYTVGQREGLGIAKGFPLYVKQIQAQTNTIVVGNKDEACAREFYLSRAHFASSRRKPDYLAKKKIALQVKIRYNHKESPARLIRVDNKLKVIFNNPQFAVTTGQSAVFYHKDTVIGGGIIEEVIC